MTKGRKLFVKFFSLMIIGVFIYKPTMATGDLVWSISIDDNIAIIEVNSFINSKNFPFDYIRITKLTRNHIPVVKNLEGRDKTIHIRKDERLEIAPLNVDINGTFTNNNVSQTLTFYPESQVAKPLTHEKFSVLKMPGQTMIEDENVVLINLSKKHGHKIDSWIRLPEFNFKGHKTDFALVNTGLQTLYFNITDPEALCKPFPYLLFNTAGTTISNRSLRIAAVVTETKIEIMNVEGKSQISSTIGSSEKLVIIDYEGTIKHETSFSNHEYGNLHLTPNGKTLYFTRIEKHKKNSETQIMALDVDNGLMTPLNIPDGNRYYCNDASKMLIVQMGFGLAHYFDITNPYDPKLLWTYSAEDIIFTGSLKHDGSMVALQIQNGNSESKRVIVLDDAINEIAQPVRATENINMAGLQWEGKYLFVGIQKHTLPPTAHKRSTTLVRAYDFSE